MKYILTIKLVTDLPTRRASIACDIILEKLREVFPDQPYTVAVNALPQHEPNEEIPEGQCVVKAEQI